jgi:hypothetical protein
MARLGRENTFYAELMVSPGMRQARALGAKTVWSTDFAGLGAAVERAGLAGVVSLARAEIDAMENRARSLLACGTPAADPGCQVTIRYLAQVIRSFPREQVFAQVALGAELAKSDPRVVGLNLVAPEDDPGTLRDYTDQMRIVGFLTDRGQSVNVTLHAGELALGLVPPEDLTFHIRQAVEIAGAKRIGHGVDIGWETDAMGLLDEMRRKEVLVEINLTSNDQILGVRAPEHPFPLYRAKGVPVALSTDDAGVSRIDLTHEYQRAARDYQLSYPELKALARNAVHFSFLAPADKALEEARLEAEFARFEATDWPGN